MENPARKLDKTDMNDEEFNQNLSTLMVYKQMNSMQPPKEQTYQKADSISIIPFIVNDDTNLSDLHKRITNRNYEKILENILNTGNNFNLFDDNSS